MQNKLCISFLFLSFTISLMLHADFELTSLAFKDKQSIPLMHACEQLGYNRSPPFQWTDAPSNTKSFALICHDPDAIGKEFIHWIIFNIPAQVDHLETGIIRQKKLPNGAIQGINHFQRLGYDGPCPPPGSPHRYLFTLYALDRTLPSDKEMTSDAFYQAIEGHVLGKTEMTGLFQR